MKFIVKVLIKFNHRLPFPGTMKLREVSVTALVTDVLICQATEEELVLLQLLSFLLEGVLQLVICCCGILGNTISILLLLGKHMKVRGLLGVPQSLNVETIPVCRTRSTSCWRPWRCLTWCTWWRCCWSPCASSASTTTTTSSSTRTCCTPSTPSHSCAPSTWP